MEMEKKEIEEVKKFKNLGYIFSANGSQKEHIKKRVRKGAVVMREMWGKKKRFGKNWARRMWLFDRLVWVVMSYEKVEIWKWKEKDKIEIVQDRFVK